MKTLMAMLLLFCIAVFAKAQTFYKSAVIGFYNLENLYDTIFHGSNDDVNFTPSGSKAYTSAVFNDKLAKLAKVISEIGINVSPDGPAMLGIAEIENRYVLDTLLRHPLIADRNYKYVHYNSKDFRGVDVALVYNPKYFKVERSRPIFVRIPAGAKETVYTRDILWVKGLLDGERINVFVNHWPSRAGGEKRSEPARIAAATTIRTFMDSLLIIDPSAKMIVMGDLNDDPINNSITKGLKATGNSRSISPDDLYNPWFEMYKNGFGTLAYQDAWSLFDQIIISSSFLDKKQTGFFYYRHHIFKADYMIENNGRYKGYPMRSYNGDVYRGGYSDHFPTYVVLLKKVE
ncbi:endonuclease/exonuclease/phosphatase family protein [Niabella ginsengisoli]|uniref:Endonuclease/exonuclease/phosphatase n=1 Tax=Niabella ginsengisoli TaxID=522298 RepID=A0ABS9SP33_9BACT|nr:endonuclease/exonuclease/phosphatase [Niabella ginsengisoli]MCH5600130.1 endonuclease/exonuclease/phosphatase [Niabella ginsengisoli]